MSLQESRQLQEQLAVARAGLERFFERHQDSHSA
jgi:hypothetical protein